MTGERQTHHEYWAYMGRFIRRKGMKKMERVEKRPTEEEREKYGEREMQWEKEEEE